MPRRRVSAASLAEEICALLPAPPLDVRTTYARLAHTLDVAEDLVREAVADLRARGRITTGPAGSRGMHIALLGAPRTTPAPPAVRPGPSAPAAGPGQVSRRGRQCRHCGAGYRLGWRFCGSCGRPLPDRPDRPPRQSRPPVTPDPGSSGHRSAPAAGRSTPP